MNKNNYNKKTSWLTIVIIAVVVLGLGYFLFKSSPNTSQQASNQADSMSSMHGGSAGAPNTEQLNSLVGKPMPDIQLSDKDGKTYTPANFKGKNTVLFFNEGLMCYPA